MAYLGVRAQQRQEAREHRERTRLVHRVAGEDDDVGADLAQPRRDGAVDGAHAVDVQVGDLRSDEPRPGGSRARLEGVMRDLQAARLDQRAVRRRPARGRAQRGQEAAAVHVASRQARAGAALGGCCVAARRVTAT
jgi:hypothetical protein